MSYFPISEVIPETNLVMFAPHYDDFLLGLGGYCLELERAGHLSTKTFHIVLVFSRSNYQNGSGNTDISLERIKMATGRRIIEELNCLDELLGARNYRYELLGERECMLRGKTFAEDEMEFPHGMYPDFTLEDWEIFNRLKSAVRKMAVQTDTALIFPLAIKEHIDHFITRQAGITVAEEMGSEATAGFYFQEDKPYAGLQTVEERKRVEQFVRDFALAPRLYRHHPEKVAELAFTHYISQVDPAYRSGILNRAMELKAKDAEQTPRDQIFVYKPRHQGNLS